MGSEHRWWFSLVAARPNPEAEEQVNVALLIGNGSLLRLEYSEDLPRLRCIAGPVDIRLMSEALRGAARELGRFEHLSTLRQYLGPQVRVSEPRPLLRPPDRETIRLLKQKYLADVRKKRRRSRVAERTSMIDETIRAVVSRKAFGLQIQKRVSPEKLFFEDHTRLFDVPVPYLDRAIRSGHRDLLIGGIAIDHRRPLQSMQTPGIRVGRAFWHYREARERIRDLTGREVRTVGLIYNGVRAEEKEAAEALEYVAHIWGQDADAVLHADEPGELYLFERQVDWVAD